MTVIVTVVKSPRRRSNLCARAAPYHACMACLVVIMIRVQSSSSASEESCLIALAERVGLGAQVGSGRAGLREVAAKGGLDERAEDELGTAVERPLAMQ